MVHSGFDSSAFYSPSALVHSGLNSVSSAFYSPSAGPFVGPQRHFTQSAFIAFRWKSAASHSVGLRVDCPPLGRLVRSGISSSGSAFLPSDGPFIGPISIGGYSASAEPFIGPFASLSAGPFIGPQRLPLVGVSFTFRFGRSIGPKRFRRRSSPLVRHSPIRSAFAYSFLSGIH